jgi:bifunctional UDP-N-acetylglucosamine pyrophosphorylase/glucosamine-1-phosphate N-acetyltransferase
MSNLDENTGLTKVSIVNSDGANRSNLSVIILAGGLGKRMCSPLPKVLHTVLGKPMLVHVLENALTLSPKVIYIIVGKYETVIRNTLEQYVSIDNIVFVNQPEALGTGHAIQCARPHLLSQPEADRVLILSGDVPLLKSATMKEVMSRTMEPVTIMTSTSEDPTGYGRIIIDPNAAFIKIVEEKDCDDQERKIDVVNAGVYAFQIGLLCKYLPMISNNNAQHEYYLTDLFEIVRKHESIEIGMFHLPIEKSIELTGINTKEQLEELEATLLRSLER